MKKELRKFANCLVNLSGIEVSMNVEQLRAYRSGELSLAEIKIINEVEKDLNFVFENKAILKMVTFGMAFALTITINAVTAHAATQQVGLDPLGNKLLGVIQDVGKWVILAKALIDIIKDGLNGGDNMRSIGRTIMSHILMFVSLYLLPWLFDTIRSYFI